MVSPEDILSARILIVDDNETNILLMERALRNAGYTAVESTTNPREVCDLYRRNAYGLILLDIQMPEMDGFEVMQELGQIPNVGYLPIVVTTAEPAHKVRALKAGARDFVGKPFEMAELRARVRNVLEIGLLHLEAQKYRGLWEEASRELRSCRE